jgi:hypothetical protein
MLKAELTVSMQSWVSFLNEIMHINGHDCMVVGFTSTYAISAYHHYCELKSWSHLEIPSENYIINLEYKL